MGSKGGRKGIQHIAQTELINFPAASHLAAALITQGKTRAHEGAEFQPGGTGRPQALSVRCPTCGAKPGEKCELGTGLPRTDPHRDRRLVASDK